MTTGKPDDDQLACFVCSLNLSGLTMTKVILWLVAITLVSFALGTGILVLSGGFPPAPSHDISPFLNTAFLTPGVTSAPLNGAATGDVMITIGAGELTVQGGAPETTLMNVTVLSRTAGWQPELVQTTNNSRKFVTLNDKGNKSREWFFMHHPNTWEISLNDNIPLRLEVNVGGGDNSLALGTLSLETLEVHTSAGDTVVDLGGYHKGRFDATIRNDVGDLILRIPRESNTRIRVNQGIGDITGNGLVQNDDTFVTAGFNPSLAVNEITLNQGVGSIVLETI